MCAAKLHLDGAAVTQPARCGKRFTEQQGVENVKQILTGGGNTFDNSGKFLRREKSTSNFQFSSTRQNGV